MHGDKLPDYPMAKSATALAGDLLVFWPVTCSSHSRILLELVSYAIRICCRGMPPNGPITSMGLLVPTAWPESVAQMCLAVGVTESGT